MAPKPSFPSNQEEWIKKAVMEYIAKTAHGKCWEHGKPAPKDDSDLSTWVESKGVELEKAFPDFYTSLDPKELDTFRKKFTTKFRNAKNDEKERLHKRFFDVYFSLPFIPMTSSATTSSPAPAINPTIAQTDKSSLSLLNPVAAPTGHDLFIADQKTKINAAVKEEHEKRGLDHHHHAALFQAKCKSLYNVISVEEKETWSMQAKEMEVGQDIYQNQHWLVYEMTCLLNGLIGSDAHQVRNAAFTLLWGFHDKHENIQFGSISAAPDAAPCFSDDEVTWPNIANDWMKYCTQTLPLNHPVECRKPAPALSATTVAFPNFTKDTSVKDVRSMVKTFLEKQWAAVNTGAISWTAIKADQQVYVNAELPPNLPLGDPETLSKGNIIDLADFFKGRILNIFSVIKNPSLSSKDKQPTELPMNPMMNTSTIKQTAQGPSVGELNTSIGTLWHKVTGGGTVPPLSSTTESTPPEKPTPDGVACDENGGNGGEDISSALHDTEENEGKNEEAGNGAGDSHDVNEKMVEGDANDSMVSAALEGGSSAGEEEIEGASEHAGGSTVVTGRGAAEDEVAEQPKKRVKKSALKLTEPLPPRHSERSHQKDEAAEPEEKIEYKELPGHKGYMVIATPKKRK